MQRVALMKRRGKLMEIRNNLRGADLHQKRMTNSKGDANKHLRDNRMVNLCPGMNEEVGLLMTKCTIGHILCCRCGTQIVPNGANMCVKCLRSESGPTKRLPLRINIIHCPDCQSYFQPPTTWVKAPLESKGQSVSKK